MENQSTPKPKKIKKRQFKRLPYDLMASVPATSFQAFEDDGLPDVIPNLWDSQTSIVVY